MDAVRIAEMTEEYERAVMEDVEVAREALAPISTKNALFYEAAFLEDGEINWWMLHGLLELSDARDAVIEALGKKSYDRLFWAFQHDDDYFERYLDITYDLPQGDYIITDPCYICDETNLPWDERVWHGKDLACWGIPTSFMRDTIFGDWGCSVIDEDTHEELGMFGADAGLVVVAKLDEVLAVNPSFDRWIENHSWCVATIYDFEGQLTFEVSEYTYEYNGTEYDGYELQLVFDGHDSNWNTVRLRAGMGLGSDE